MRPTLPTLLFSLLAPLLCECGAEAPSPPSCTGPRCTPPDLKTLDLIAGQPGGPGFVDGPAAFAHFVSPWGLVLSAEHLYIADGGNTVRVMNIADGSVSTLAGEPDVYGGTDGTGAAASFNGMTDLAATAGMVYVADTENHTLRRIDAATGAVSTLAGALAMSGSTDGNLSIARFREPEGLALSGDTLYVGDTDNSTIRQIQLGTGTVSTVAGTAMAAGNVDATGAAARFDKPKAIALDGSGVLYVLDSGNHSLRRVALPGGAVTTLATFTAELLGIAVSATDVLVTLSDHRVVKVAKDSGVVSTLCGQAGQADYVDGPCADARFNVPVGLAVDGSGGVYVADGNFVVRKIDLATATVSTAAGGHSSGSSDGTGAGARFRGASGAAVDTAGIVYVADTGNNTLRRVVLSTGEVSTLAGSAAQSGQTDATGAAARFNLPEGLALDGAGRLYVADSGNRSIRVVDLSSGAVTTLPLPHFQTPTDLALYAGRLYVSDHDDETVSAVDLATNAVTVLAGRSLAPGRTDGAGDAGRFNGPGGLVTDGAGNLYVADTLNQEIRKIVIATGQVSTLAATGIDALPFNYPSYLAVNGRGDLFIADVNNNLVRHLDLTTLAVTNVIGDPRRSGVKLGPLPAQLASLSAITLTDDGHLVLLAEDSVLLAH